MSRIADRAQNATGWVLVPCLLVASFGGIVGGIAMIVSLFSHHGTGWGIAGIVFIPVSALLFPVYFGLWQGVWWPSAWYGACGIAAAAAWGVAHPRRSDESAAE